MRLRLAFASLLVAALLAPLSSRGDVEPVWESLFEPAAGASNVPTNALIWIGRGHLHGMKSYCLCGPEERRAHNVVLNTVEGTPVPGRLHQLRNRNCGSEDVFVFVPDNGLEPSTTYRIKVGLEERIFLTGTGPKVDAPPVPRVRDSHIGERAVGFQLEKEGYLLAAVDLASAAMAATSVTAIDAVADTACEGCYFHDRLWVGEGRCGGNIPGASPGASVDVVFGGFDIAGNFSGWSAPVAATFAEADAWSCGCAAGRGAGDPVAAAAVLFALALIARRPRKRRHS